MKAKLSGKGKIRQSQWKKVQICEEQKLTPHVDVGSVRPRKIQYVESGEEARA